MKLSDMKTHFFDEAMELGLASETDIQKLATWLEENDFDADHAWVAWDNAKEEIEYLVSEFL